MRWLELFVLAGFSLGCAEQPPPKSPESSPKSDPPPEPKPASLEQAPAAEVESAPASTRNVPSECEANAELCVPPVRFSKKVCQGKFPSLALLMMEKSAPWQHRFIRDEWLEPINAHGGPSSENWLRFGEEVVLLKGTADYQGKDLKVTGPGDVDILRADGTCATVSEKALMDRTPGVSKSAPIVWKYLEEPMRQALLGDKQVAGAEDAYRAGCKGSSSSHPTKQCKLVSSRLNEAIMRALKSGIELPVPEKRPEWVPASGEQVAESGEAAKNQ